MNNKSMALRASTAQVIELTENDLASIAGGGWFRKLFGISTPGFLKRLDDKVRGSVPGGWFTVIKTVMQP